jgi:protein-S-isoprenylcysteine O-methyltransferase Ste14
LIIRTRIEEENLAARFGDSYRAYKEHTGRFLPEIGTIVRELFGK